MIVGKYTKANNMDFFVEKNSEMTENLTVIAIRV